MLADAHLVSAYPKVLDMWRRNEGTLHRRLHQLLSLHRLQSSHRFQRSRVVENSLGRDQCEFCCFLGASDACDMSCDPSSPSHDDQVHRPATF
jgi:hypothetical protein